MSRNTSHANCDHKATASARAACRRRQILANAVAPTLEDTDQPGRVLEFSTAVTVPTYTATIARHCELCGRMKPEHNEGYTTCCNEPVCYGQRSTTWAWKNHATGQTGTVDACCSARVTFPNDSISITHRAS